MIHEENQYLQCIRDIMERGYDEEGRNGSTRSLFGYSMRFSLSDGRLPLLTTKKLAWKTCFRELMWFIRGSTSNNELVSEGVHIWDANASREFLDSRDLTYLEEGDLGPVYGHQWRHFNAPYTNCHASYFGLGVDQLRNVIDQLKNPETRNSRRIIMSAWNPCQLDEMALPPCHILAQFNVRAGRYLSCALYQRSGDVGLGVPFNIASYSFLTHLLANYCGLEADEFVYFLGNAHIYTKHLDALREQIERVPFPFPRINMGRSCEFIEDYKLENITFLEEYQCHPPIKMDMVA